MGEEIRDHVHRTVILDGDVAISRGMASLMPECIVGVLPEGLGLQRGAVEQSAVEGLLS